jgi:hypothetical protein
MVLKSTFAPLEPGAGAFSIMIFTRASAMLADYRALSLGASSEGPLLTTLAPALVQPEGAQGFRCNVLP